MSDHGHAHGSGCDHGHAHGSGCAQEHGQAEPCHQHECCGHDHKDSAQGSGHDIHGHGHAHEEHRLTEGEAVQQGTPPPDAGDLTARAYDAAEAGEFVQAAALFRQACDLDPAKGRADDLEALAQCLLETGDAPGAVEAATAALRRRPEWAVAYLTLARAQLNAGAFGAAARSFRDAVARDGSLAEEVREDLETAQRLDLARDEREIVVNGVALRLQQWRGNDGGGDGGCTCAGVEATPRHGTGTMIWECGIVLAGYLMHSLTAEQLRGKRVLELGAGAGVAGLAASALGAHATLTDLEPVTRLLRCNVGLNREALLSAGGSAEVLPLDWSEAAPHGSAVALPEGLAHSGFDLVLGADLVFQPDGQQLPALVALLRRLLAPPTEDGTEEVEGGGGGRAPPGAVGARLLLAHKSRHAELDEQLLRQLRAAGISLSEIPHAEHHPDYRSSSVRLFSGSCPKELCVALQLRAAVSEKISPR